MADNDITFVINQKTQETITHSVKISSQTEWNAFVTDAINTYIELGRLRQQGADFLVVHEDRDEPLNLKFPFDVRGETA